MCVVHRAAGKSRLPGPGVTPWGQTGPRAPLPCPRVLLRVLVLQTLWTHSVTGSLTSGVPGVPSPGMKTGGGLSEAGLCVWRVHRGL